MFQVVQFIFDSVLIVNHNFSALFYIKSILYRFFVFMRIQIPREAGLIRVGTVKGPACPTEG